MEKSTEHLIEKKVIHPGKKYVKLTPGSRVRFHFQTRRLDNGQLIDDSHDLGQPMELVLGKKFKLEVWEVIIQQMSLDEVAKFHVDKSLVTEYPFISKTLRDVNKKPEERRHCCGMTLQNEGIGYKDLDELFANPTDLEFIIELVTVELPEEYDKQNWQMTDEEKMKAINSLRETGNREYRDKKFKQAEENYAHAISIVEYFMSKEKPYDVEWNEFAAMKIPLLLNYSQCRLLANDYYAVIEHCTEVLKLDPNNVKALYRRGRAHAGAWNPAEARKDFQRVIELDQALKFAVAKELTALDEQQKVRDIEDRKKLQKLF